MILDDVDEVSLRTRPNEMKLEHRDLDAITSAFSEEPESSQIQLRRMKKRKLLLKDQIARMESRLISDLNV